MLNCLDRTVSGTSEGILLCINHTHPSFNTHTKAEDVVKQAFVAGSSVRLCNMLTMTITCNSSAGIIVTNLVTASAFSNFKSSPPNRSAKELKVTQRYCQRAECMHAGVLTTIR